MSRRATYRVQLRPGFGFDEAAAILPYLEALGISDLYTSPILQAAAGSDHGYDVVDHSRLSVDLGGEPAFDRLVARLRERSMGLTADIVPNHMAIDGRANRWWWDVLENGPSSLYASYFDIDWSDDTARQEPTVLVPVLGQRYGRALELGELKVAREEGSFTVVYFDHEVPLSPRTQDGFLARAAESIGCDALGEIASGFGRLPHARLKDPDAVRVRHEEKERLRAELAGLTSACPGVAAAIDRELVDINSDPDELDRLLSRQNYRLSYWRVGREELDYRRFFNIETLVGLRVEDERVFADTHQTVARVVRDGSVNGLRVDHVDGLRDPDGYLERLGALVAGRPAAGTPAAGPYIAVEKILHAGERLPADWPVQGTTGYDFMFRVANAYVDPAGEEPLTRCYARLTGEPAGYAAVVRAAKSQIMTEELAPEMDRLTRLFHAVCDDDRRQRDRTRGEIRNALTALLVSFPVYRTYLRPGHRARPADLHYVATAVRAAKETSPETDPDLLDFMGEVLALQRQYQPGSAASEFAQTFPQVSAPVLAKGVEDTAFYRYNRLVSLNEVGGDPGVFGRSLEDFHRDCADSAARQPAAMLALATHDTKRSPDVRARISLLSELPDEWEATVTSWMGMSDGLAGPAGPDYNMRYLFFQTLVGVWPIEKDRLLAYMDKAAKEAKVYTSWADPNADYDYCLRKFAEATIDDEHFVEGLEGFLSRHRLAALGRATSLSQTALLLTCPGIPDVYQGTETWDNSLVDPDNRRRVDFAGLTAGLACCAGRGPTYLSERPVGRDAKQWLIQRLLRHRRRRPWLYDTDRYTELPVMGQKSPHLIAFARGNLAVLAARHLHRLGGDWADTTVFLPPGGWGAVIGAARGAWAGGRHAVAEILGDGPVAVLENAANLEAPDTLES